MTESAFAVLSRFMGHPERAAEAIRALEAEGYKIVVEWKDRPVIEMSVEPPVTTRAEIDEGFSVHDGTFLADQPEFVDAMDALREAQGLK